MYLDSNGIAVVEDTDEFAPHQVLLNSMQAATSDALGGMIRFYKVANTTERNALAISLGVSATNPVFVYRADAVDGEEFEYSTNGTAWSLLIPAKKGELFYVVPVITGAYTASAQVANRGVTDAATTYDRVVEYEAHLNCSGITANSVWAGVVTSSGANVTVNVQAFTRFPFVTGVATGGGVTLAGSFDLAAGATCNPRLWVQEIASGTITISTPSYFKYRIRPAG